MSATQQEITVKMGLDARQFEQRLRETDRIARQFANRAGAAMNVGGGPDGHTPASWSMAGLSGQSKSLAGSRTGFGGLLDSIKQASPQVSGLIDKFGGMATKLGIVGAAAGVAKVTFGAFRDSMREAWQLAQEGEALGTTSKFLIDFGRSAMAAGESAGEATGKLYRLQMVLAAAAEGSKEAQDKLTAIGVNPFGKSMEQVVSDIADAFAKMDDPTKKAAAGMDLFGRNAHGVIQTLGEFQSDKGKSKFGILEQRDLDTLAEGEKRLRKFGAVIKDTVGDAVKSTAATWLRWTGLVKNAPEAIQSRIERDPKSKDQIRQEQEDLAKARDAYNTALRNSYDTQTRLAYAMSNAKTLQQKIASIAGETVEKYELQEKLLKQQQEIQRGQKELGERRQAQLEKEQQYQTQLVALENARTQAVASGKQALADRAGWSVSEIQNQQDPSQLLAAANRFMIAKRGRGLTGKELAEMSRNWREHKQGAFEAQNAAEAAKAFAMLLPGMAGEATSAELSIRKSLHGLTSSERDPFAGMSQGIKSIEHDIAALLAKASSEGININPRMGR